MQILIDFDVKTGALKYKFPSGAPLALVVGVLDLAKVSIATTGLLPDKKIKPATPAQLAVLNGG